MKREIKFRLWDTNEKEFVEQKDIAVKGNGEVMADTGKEWAEDIDKDDFILSQFIGLKDKNGKDVYEGDIVEIDWFHVEDKTYETISYDSDFGYYKYGNAPLCELTDRHTFKVIGNIYENQELIK